MIDFIKISKINTKKELKKFKIDEPIFLNNYLFHYLIMTNNLKGIKLDKFPIYKENNEGLQGLHLAAKVANETKNYDMLNYLLERYPEYAANLNYFKESFLDMLDVNDNIFTILKKHKDINWYRLFTNIVENEDYKSCYIDKIFKTGSFKLIDYIVDYLEEKKFKWREFQCSPLFMIPLNEKLKTKDKISIFKKVGLETLFKIIDSSAKSLIYYIIDSNDIDLLKFVIEKEIDLDKYTSIFTRHPFLYSYFKDSNSDKDFKMTKLIYNNIKETHNFDSTNKFYENIVFVIMNYRLLSGNGNDEIEKDILLRNTVWNKQNIDKENLFEILVNLSFEKYHKMISKNVRIDLKLKNKENKTILEIAPKKWKGFLKTLKEIDYKDCEESKNVKLDKLKLANSNTFSSTIFDAALFFMHLEKKYKNLYIPKFLNKTEENLYWDNGFDFPDPFLNQYNNFPWAIYWKDKYNYHIHPYLNQLINGVKNSDKYDNACILLSVLLPHGGLHAMLLFYDFKNNFIERFDPYGNTFDMDVDLDDIMEEELTWNTGLSYVNVKKYLPVAGFQNLSDENNSKYQKPGDFGGYCLAWCLWYLELRLKNFQHSAKKLVKKAISKILSTEPNMITFIRNYANNIDKHRLDYIVKAGIDKEKASNRMFEHDDSVKLINYIIKNTTIKK